jgi:hypothetical protein
VSPQELAESAARSLRGALNLENLREQDPVSRYDLMVYWRDALRVAGFNPPRTGYLAVLGFAETVAGLRSA